jgi:hypothetical protein
MASERRERFRRRLHDAVVAGLREAAEAAPAQKMVSSSVTWSPGVCCSDGLAASLTGARPAARTAELGPPPAKRRSVAHVADIEGESDHETSTRMPMQHIRTRKGRERDFLNPSSTALSAGLSPAASPLDRACPGPAGGPGALPAAAEGHASASVNSGEKGPPGRQQARHATATTAGAATTAPTSTRPCRHSLQPPQGPQPFKYVETVRGKEQRAQLSGWSCTCCRDFYEAVQAHPRRGVGARQVRRRQALLQLQRRADAAAAGEGRAACSSASAAAITAAAVRAALRELEEDDAALAARGAAAAADAAPILSDRPPPRAAQAGLDVGGRKARAAAAVAVAGLSKDASRHRARFEPDHTPPGFWALDSLPSDAEVPAKPFNPHR